MRTGVFMISGGKDSVAAAHMLKDQYQEKVGIMVAVDGVTYEDLEYNDYLEQLLGMPVLLTTHPAGALERWILERSDKDDVLLPMPNPVHGGPVVIRRAARLHGYSNFDMITGLSKGDRDARLAVAGIFKRGPRSKAPLIEMEDDQIHDYLSENDISLHPMYSKGFNKHGAYPCVMWASQPNIHNLETNVRLLKELMPERYEYWTKWEEETGVPFFKLRQGEYLKIGEVL